MGVIATTLEQWDWNRTRTLATLDEIAKRADAVDVLGFRPGPGRAHIAWQLTHIAMTEELFATERLLPGTSPAWPDLVPRFKGGSIPDNVIPGLAEIRDLLLQSREHLVSTISAFSDADLDDIPESMRERGWTLGRVLQVLTWHEPHHQGQAHISLNLWKAERD